MRVVSLFFSVKLFSRVSSLIVMIDRLLIVSIRRDGMFEQNRIKISQGDFDDQDLYKWSIPLMLR